MPTQTILSKQSHRQIASTFDCHDLVTYILRNRKRLLTIYRVNNDKMIASLNIHLSHRGIFLWPRCIHYLNQFTFSIWKGKKFTSIRKDNYTCNYICPSTYFVPRVKQTTITCTCKFPFKYWCMIKSNKFNANCLLTWHRGI